MATGVRFKNGSWRFRLTLRTGRRVELTVPPPADGGAYDATYADAFAAHARVEYRAGRWSPEAPAVAPPVAAGVTVLAYARAVTAAWTYESAPKDRAAIERYLAGDPLGTLEVRAVRPRHVRDFRVRLVARKSDRDHKPLAARSVRNAFDLVRRVFRAAQVDELLTTNPADAVRGELPAIVDKDPSARATWEFTLEHVVALCTDPRVPEVARVENALDLLGGGRPGERRALRWADWHRTLKPLGALVITRAIKSVSGDEGHTKTAATKRVPVHPFLERVLADWFATGWARHMGRDPAPGDLVVPSVRGRRKGQPGNTSAQGRAFKRACVALGIPPLRQYAKRHTLVRLLVASHAARDVVRWATHAPPTSAFDGYADAPRWADLCAEFLKLPLPVPTGTETGTATPPPSQSSGDPRENEHGSTEESNQPAALASGGIRNVPAADVGSHDGIRRHPAGPNGDTSPRPARPLTGGAWLDLVDAHDAFPEGSEDRATVARILDAALRREGHDVH